MRSEYGLMMLIAFCSASAPLLCGAAEATSQIQDGSGVSVGELSAVQSETFLYQAKAERAKAIRSIDGDATQNISPAQPSYQPQPMPQGRSGPPQADVLPVVKMISGSSRAMHATLLYSGGFEVETQVGSSDLPGGYRLESISLDSVVLTRGGKRYPLGFSNRAPSAGITANPPMTSTNSPFMPVGQPAPISLPGQY